MVKDVIKQAVKQIGSLEISLDLESAFFFKNIYF